MVSGVSSEARSSEGLNAHLIVCDELHCWNGRLFWDSLKFAFAARSKPLLFIITTAGTDRESVCYEQRTYAKSIIDGTHFDPSYFGYIRAAEAHDDQFSEATWTKANPSYGITLTREEFEDSAREAQKTPSSLAAFSRYRLCIWNSVENAWLKPDDWTACRSADPAGLAKRLEGMPCCCGMDSCEDARHDQRNWSSLSERGALLCSRFSGCRA